MRQNVSNDLNGYPPIISFYCKEFLIKRAGPYFRVPWSWQTSSTDLTNMVCLLIWKRKMLPYWRQNWMNITMHLSSVGLFLAKCLMACLHGEKLSFVGRSLPILSFCEWANTIHALSSAEVAMFLVSGLPVILRMLRIKSDKSDWLRLRNDYSWTFPEVAILRAGQKERGL